MRLPQSKSNNKVTKMTRLHMIGNVLTQLKIAMAENKLNLAAK